MDRVQAQAQAQAQAHARAGGRLGRLRGQRLGPAEAAVAVAVIFGLWVLQPETSLVWRANDSSIHMALVRWVTGRLMDGHLPFDGWFPYLSLGAARFHHYQSLPHLLTGTVGLSIGPDRAFAWSLYLLLATWPVSVFLGGRLLGLDRSAAAAAAAIAPLVASSQRMGIQWPTYVWQGFGAWTQLWGMWALPVVMGLTWQAIALGRRRWAAATVLALIIPIHLVMAYVAVLLVPVWAILDRDVVRRTTRAASIGTAALFAAAWFALPLVLEGDWVTRNLLADPIAYESVGLRAVIDQFLAGQTLDAGRFPVITCLALGGMAVALPGSRRDASMRAVLAATALGGVLYAGAATFGWLGLLPGMSEIFMSRFIAALQVPCLFLAGIAVAWVLRWAIGSTDGKLRLASAALAVAAIATALSPAVGHRIRGMEIEAAGVAQQEQDELADRPQLRELLAIAAARGPGRVYQSLNPREVDPFRLGSTPFYMAFLSEGADAIGFTRPTWSILSDIESGFDEQDARQYPVFGIRYVIGPPGVPPAVPAMELASRGCCVLWQIGDVGYLRLARSTRAVTADRFTLLERAREWFASDDFDRGAVWTIGYAGAEAPDPTGTSGPAEDQASLGRILQQKVRLEDGLVVAGVEVSEPSLLVLSATFDPGWTATVDRVPVAPQMVSPGVVAVPVEPGSHVVRFEWKSFPHYGPLLLGWLAPVALWWWDRRRQGVRTASVGRSDAYDPSIV